MAHEKVEDGWMDLTFVTNLLATLFPKWTMILPVIIVTDGLLCPIPRPAVLVGQVMMVHQKLLVWLLTPTY